jgi:hypothetical protein
MLISIIINCTLGNVLQFPYQFAVCIFLSLIFIQELSLWIVCKLGNALFWKFSQFHTRGLSYNHGIFKDFSFHSQFPSQYSNSLERNLHTAHEPSTDKYAKIFCVHPKRNVVLSSKTTLLILCYFVWN